MNDQPAEPFAPMAAPLLTPQAVQQLGNLHHALLHKRRWVYLRYLHTRQGLLRATGTRSVLVVGAGFGLAEIGLAIEFPEITFHLTDHGAASHSFDRARTFAERFGLGNVSFGTLDILAPDLPEKSFDTIVSVEVMEHLWDDWRAARNMLRLARAHVFTLVPFATQASNADPRTRERVLKSSEHVRAGYDESMLAMLFPGPGLTRGCYWRDAGGPFRKHLESISDQELAATRETLFARAEADIRPDIPVGGDAQGIWRLSKVAVTL